MAQNSEGRFTLTEFCISQSGLLKAFTRWWREQQRFDPTGHPDTLPPEEWMQRVQDWFTSQSDVSFDTALDKEPPY